MLKLSILFVLVICSHSILPTDCLDDEFAEFDDLASNEVNQEISSQSVRDNVNIKEKIALQSGDKIESNKPSDETFKGAKEGIHAADEEVKETKTINKPDLKLVNAPSPKIYRWDSYYIEFGFIIASFLYFVNFFAGSSKNHKFAQQWYMQMKEILKQQFSLVGGSPQLSDGPQKRVDDVDPSVVALKKQKGLIKSTESMYTLWNSGRIGMDGLLIEINLLKRQDLFSMALNLIKPSKDTLILRFLLTQDGYENFVFCLAHKSYAPKLARDMVDINTYCPKRKPISQCGVQLDRLFVMSELGDVTPFILDQTTASFLKKYEQSINYFHITDQYSTVRNSEEMLPAQKLAKSKRMATFSFNLSHDSTERADFILFSLNLLDRLRRFKLARDSKQKSEKNRQKITDIIQKTAFSQRQEAAQAKKEELRRLEKERMIHEDDPEKLKSWEKKEAKRELKKNKMRVKQLKVKSM